MTNMFAAAPGGRCTALGPKLHPQLVSVSPSLPTPQSPSP
eukprot:CAMPEP_0184724416 /NCGR_PEP_ID=MMETSP0314-20130426/27868_1 /TAXON_ID=38298 /ORGANISM="Rhodella maculata, Strain CCMP 736" /LENGTH=39 /DNA_ID= /DNA_START= /DNA_END= /DNA_ORIENTATION=